MAAVVLFMTGCVFFPSCYFLLRALLRRQFPCRLSDVDASYISVKCVSSLQAVMTTSVGYIIVQTCPDIMTDRHWLSNNWAWFGLPYFYYDTYAMYYTHCLFHPHLADHYTPRWASVKHFFRRNIVMMFHHIIMPVVFFVFILILRKGQGDYFVGVFYMIEVVIPFISLFTVLNQLKLKNQMYAIVSGLVMIVVFVVTRFLVFPFLFWSYGRYKNIPLWDVPTSIPIKCNIGCGLLLLPQVYWLSLMTKGAYRVLVKRNSTNALKSR